jgi:hypothetical protein
VGTIFTGCQFGHTLYRLMHLIKCSLKTIFQIFILITRHGGSVELANKLNDGVSLIA